MSIKKNVLDCAIIGSGISGIFASLYLNKGGLNNICIFEKSGGLGGRLATRRVEDGKFDHGAQYLDIETIKNVPEIISLMENNIIFYWKNAGICVSEGGMTSIAKFLASTIEVHKKFKLKSIKDVGSEMELDFENGERVYSKSIIFSSPIPQTREILDNSDLNINNKLFSQLDNVVYDPCIVILLESNKEVGNLNKGFGNDCIGGNIAWIADNNKKTISNRKNFFTVLCSAEFSKVNLEKTYDEINSMVKNDLKNIFADGYKILSNHKWRYSTPNIFYKNGLSINVGRNFFIGMCGDAFANGKFDGAVESGIEAAKLYLDKRALIKKEMATKK